MESVGKRVVIAGKMVDSVGRLERAVRLPLILERGDLRARKCRGVKIPQGSGRHSPRDVPLVEFDGRSRSVPEVTIQSVHVC